MDELIIRFHKREFEFKRPSGTSRGVLTHKRSWFLEVHHASTPHLIGRGECSVIEGLSPDFVSDEQYESVLNELIKNPAMDLTLFPSIHFGLECAKLDLKNGGKGVYFDNAFTLGKMAIPINGLIWMGSEEFMKEQIAQKLDQGFRTIKMKIGAIDIDTEMKLLSDIRSKYGPDKITIRVDANGAFTEEEAYEILDRLALLKVHSIEQPIKAGQWEAMRRLCLNPTTDIALDEELIGVNSFDEKRELLDVISPQYIILKPSLHGGFSGCREWIKLVEERDIKWWMTSALESNMGLDAIAQFTAEFENLLPQGLGTGGLFTENLPSDLTISEGNLLKNR